MIAINDPKKVLSLAQAALSDGTTVEIGLKEHDRKSIAQALSVVLADTYALYLKTQNFHWNVTGPKFISLHLLFEQQYTQLAKAVDILAERIRALGFLAPGSFSEFAKLTSLPEQQAVESADEMIFHLVQGHELVVRSVQKAGALSEDAHDDPTFDLMSRRAEEHEKLAWMLRSLLN